MEFGAIFFCGGLRCIDFCNTFDHLHTPPQYDRFPDRATILQWGQAAGILPSDFQDTSTTDGRFYAEALETRSLVFRLLLPFTQFNTPAESDLAAFNTRLQEVSRKMQIVSTAKGYALVYHTDDLLEQVTCEAVRSVADLLLTNRLERVRQCGECGWLFYDSSRNQSRRWCEMNSCGNRAKARRHYERVKQRRIAAA
jgi:predicted RNA-binding Zn ribbon-like protein